MTPPVALPDGSAFLPDGTHVPETAIARAVDAISAACRVIEALPPEQRMALQVEALFAGLDGGGE